MSRVNKALKNKNSSKSIVCTSKWVWNVQQTQYFIHIISKQIFFLILNLPVL